MSDIQVADLPAQLVLHGDEDTPREFIVDLLRRVFGK
jgi:ATP-dependent Clp protease adapter protein ClpS